MERVIRVASDFTDTPGARSRSQGDFSGEEFRETVLIPAVLEARKHRETIKIDLDGTYGYPPSFLEEAFGGLVRTFPSDDFSRMFEFVTFDEPSLPERIALYIKNGNADAKKRR